MRKGRYILKFIILFLLLIITWIFHIFQGIGINDEPINRTILTQIRLPRSILAILSGGGLALCGTALQGMFRNSLVEPYTLGVSGGAAIGVAVSLLLPFQRDLGFAYLTISGFLGALSVLLILYLVAIKDRKLDMKNLLLIGVMISFISSSILMLILSVSKIENLHGIVFWMMGSLGNSSNETNLILSFIILSILIIFYFMANDLNAIQFGYEKSTTLGVDTDKVLKTTVVLSALITASIVSITGIIGFVGLIIPHLMKKIFYNDFRILFITSFLGGGFFLLLSDFVSTKIIYPNELPIGVITGIIGGVFFIYIFKRERIR